MVTGIGEITVGTLLKRVEYSFSPYVTEGKVYEVVGFDSFGVKVINDLGNYWTTDLYLYEIVGHVGDDDIIQELDQMLEINLLRNRAVAIIGHMTGTPLGFGVLTEEELRNRKLYQNITGSK